MASSKFFKLLFAPAGSDLSYQLESTDILGFNWVQVPLNSELGDLNITEGEALTAENIGGKLKDMHTQKGFSGAEGSFKSSVPLSETSNNFPTELLPSGYGASGKLAATSVDIATLTAGQEQTGTFDNGTGDHAALDGLYFVRIVNSSGENERYTMAGLYVDAILNTSFILLGDHTVTVGDVIHVLDFFNLNEISSGYFHFIAQAPDGYCHLLQYCGITNDINLDEGSKILEATNNILSLGKSEDNNDTAMQAALNTAITNAGCINHDTALTTNICSVIKYDPSDFAENVAVNPDQTVMTGNGLTNFKTEHTRGKAIVTGNANTNGKVAIDEVSNSLKVTLSVYDLTLETALREAYKDQEIFGLYTNNSDYTLQFNFPSCKISAATNAVDNNGLHTVDFIVEANQSCQDNYSYIKGLL